MELQLKGLISENDGRVYKSHILQEDPQIFSLFMEYFEDIIDQIELTQKLKNINKNKKQDENNKSEELVRLVIKYSKRNSFELLRNLALQGNHYVMKCFDRYQKDHNGHILSTSLEKVANYYRAKNRLEERLDDEEF